LTATSVASGTYYVRVRARNASGTGAASDEIVVTVTGACPLAGSPSELTSSVAGSDVTLTWQPPAGVWRPTAYVIEAGSATG
jgi:hypothetical protein